MAWSFGGWLLTPFLQSIGAEAVGRLRARVAAELTTTFAGTYTREVSLAGMLRPGAFHAYVKRATGEKFLVMEDPWDRATPLPLVKSCSWRMGGSLMLLFGASSRRIPGSVRRSL